MRVKKGLALLALAGMSIPCIGHAGSSIVCKREISVWANQHTNFAVKSDQYVAKNLSLEMKRALVSPAKAKKRLERILLRKRHSHGYYSERVLDYKDTPSVAYDLTQTQLTRAYLMVDRLKDKKFRERIGKLLEDDIADPFSEHGGLVVFNDGKLDLLPVQSEYARLQNTEYDVTYRFPWSKRSIPHIARYHMHATDEDCTDSATPSGRWDSDDGDLCSARLGAKHYGESHGFVITKLRGKTFNVDYYGAIKQKCVETITWEDLEVKLDRPRYIKNVIDLGVYSY